jgi:hypothetical protein
MAATFIKSHFDSQHKTLTWGPLVRRHFTRKANSADDPHPFPEDGSPGVNHDGSSDDEGDDEDREEESPQPVWVAYAGRGADRREETLAFMKSKPKRRQDDGVLSMLMAICDALPIGHVAALGFDQEEIDAFHVPDTQTVEENPRKQRRVV